MTTDTLLAEAADALERAAKFLTDEIGTVPHGIERYRVLGRRDEDLDLARRLRERARSETQAVALPPGPMNADREAQRDANRFRRLERATTADACDLVRLVGTVSLGQKLDELVAFDAARSSKY